MKEDPHIDAEIIQNFLNGDQSAITLLVKRWHLKFCNKSYWIVKDSELAKDVAQESWQIIINKLETLNNPLSFKSWAFRIVCYKSFDVLRERRNILKQNELIRSNTKEATVDSGSEQEKKIKLLLTEIEGLPTPQQMVIRLFYLEEQSIKEISKLLGISVGTVKSRLFHAREKLKLSIKNKTNEN